MCCTIKILISNWPRKQKFSHLLQGGKSVAFDFVTMVTRWSRSTSNFYALIGQNSTGDFMRKIYASSWNLLTLTAEADRVLCQLVNCLFPLDVQNEMQLLSRVFCYSWLVCLSPYWLRNAPLVKVENPISDGIVFVFHLAWCAGGLQSLERFWPYFIAAGAASWMESLSNSCIWCLLCLFGFALLLFFFLISWSRTYFNLCGLFVHVCKIWDNDLTYPIRFDQINHLIIYFNTLRQRAKKTRSKYERV